MDISECISIFPSFFLLSSLPPPYLLPSPFSLLPSPSLFTSPSSFLSPSLLPSSFLSPPPPSLLPPSFFESYSPPFTLFLISLFLTFHFHPFLPAVLTNWYTSSAQYSVHTSVGPIRVQLQFKRTNQKEAQTPAVYTGWHRLQYKCMRRFAACFYRHRSVSTTSFPSDIWQRYSGNYGNFRSFYEYFRVGVRTSVALSPGHSQILSRSRGDKIWEWPGDEGREYVRLIVNFEIKTHLMVYNDIMFQLVLKTL